MPLVNNLIYKRFGTQQRGYDTSIGVGTNSLKGNVGERSHIEMEVEVFWYIEPDTYSIFDNGRRISVEGTPFDTAGFSVGDHIMFSIQNDREDGYIVGMSEDGLTLFTENFTGLPNGTFEGKDTGCVITGITDITNLVYKYNYVPNESVTPNFRNSRGDLHQYKCSGIDEPTNSVDGLIYTTAQGEALGKRWRDSGDFLRVTKLANADLPIIRDSNFAGGYGVPDGIQRFKIEHRSTIQPYYLEEEYENLVNADKPSRLDDSLKYIFEVTAKEFITDADTTKQVRFLDDEGSVGWYNENFDGNRNQYQIQGVTYQDASGLNIDAIKIGEDTTVTIQVRSSDGTFDSSVDNVIVQHSLLPQTNIDTDDYFNKNYLHESARSGDFGNNISGVTQTVSSAFVASITFTIKIRSYEYNRGNTEDYLLAVSLEDDAKPSEDSDRVMLIADVNTYFVDTDIPDLLKELNGGITTNYDSNVYTESKGWVQDAVRVQFSYKYDPFIYTEYTNIQLVAWEDASINNYFVLQDYPIDSEEDYNISQNGIEFHKENVINSEFDTNQDLINSQSNLIQSIQNYNDSIYNDNLSTKSENEYYPIEDLNSKNVQLTTRYMWHDWIKQEDAPIVFTLSDQENNGLNKNVSNYSLKQGYSLKWILDTGIKSGDIVTKYVHKINTEVLNFGVNSDETVSITTGGATIGNAIVGDDTINNSSTSTTQMAQNWRLESIKTFVADGDYETDCLLLSSEDMKIQVTFENQTTPDFNLSDHRGSIQINTNDPSSETQTIEIGTDEFNLFTNDNELKTEYRLDTSKGYPLKGITNDSYCDIDKDGSFLILTCIIKKSSGYVTSLNGEVCISGRIGLISDPGIVVGDFNNDFSTDFYI